MAPKKRKSNKASLKEEEPTITLDFEDEEVKTEDKDQNTEDNSVKELIKQNMNRVNEKDGIIGYILRNTTSASIDLKDPERIIDFAVLSSSTLEASDEFSSSFGLGDVKHVLVKGDTAKLLSFVIEENRVSVFMENSVDHNAIYKELQS